MRPKDGWVKVQQIFIICFEAIKELSLGSLSKKNNTFDYLFEAQTTEKRYTAHRHELPALFWLRRFVARPCLAVRHNLVQKINFIALFTT